LFGGELISFVHAAMRTSLLRGGPLSSHHHV
jgi:hypothetical protein